jgi:Tol biopolymer transport system component
MKEQPDLTVLPVPVRTAVARCLSKDLRKRWGSIGDVRWALENAQIQAPPQDRGLRHTLWWFATAMLFAGAMGAVGWLLKPTLKPEQPVLQFEITAPEGAKFPPVGAGQLALSPDGSRLAFVATSKDARRSLWLRPLSGNAATLRPGTDDASFPFWSDDNRWLGFFADGKLQKIDVAGGRPQVICVTAGGPATWNSTGVILFGDDQGNIHRVPAAGGAPSIVFASGERLLHFPHFLPDGKRFVAHMTGKEIGVLVGSLDGKTQPFPFPPATHAASYVPNPAGGGWILYRGAGTGTEAMAQPFDPDKGGFIGAATAVVADPAISWTWSANGILAFRHSGGAIGESQLTWFDRDGKQLGIAGDPGLIVPWGFPRISPDLKTIAFVRRDALQVDIWLFDTTRGIGTRFTSAPGINTAPNWSRDGSRIFYAARNGSTIVGQQANGLGGEAMIRSQPAGQFYPTGVSPDSRWLVVLEAAPAPSRIVLFSLADGKILPLVEGGQPINGSISPDGQWLLYSSVPAHRREVFVQSLPADAGGPAVAVGRIQISTTGGTAPVWRRDGKEILYLALDGKLMAVSVKPGGIFGLPQALFATRLNPQLQNLAYYDVTPDGQRFLIDQPVAHTGDVSITVIANWPALLAKRATP